jgi:aminoglycoside phosphotransferase (APT) family kinase protein
LSIDTVHRGSTPSQILAVLHQALPGQSFQQAEVLTDGWDNLGALVDGRWIFRFPVRGEFRREAERSFLKAMQSHSPVEIPQICFWSDEPPFMGYEKLKGIFAPEAWFSDEAWLKQVAEDLAAYLLAVHRNIPLAAAQSWGVWLAPPVGQGPDGRLAGSVALEPALREKALALLQAPLEPFEPRALYGDLHFGNLLFDASTRRLRGVFDFGGVAAGDPAFELYALACRSPGLAQAIAAAYQRQGGPRLSLVNARRYAAEFCLNVLTEPSLGRMRDLALKRLRILTG